MGYLRNVYIQYAAAFFHALIPAYVIERLFWQQRGMTVQMVVYCEIIFAVTVMALEIPSGVISDKFGRKQMLCVSAALSAAELVLILFAREFWQFALAVFVAGIGHAVFSGSENALLYDSLLAAGKRDSFEKHVGRMRAVDFAGSVIAALSGGVLANVYGLSVPYVISIASTVIALAAVLFLREPPAAETAQADAGGMYRCAKQALGMFRSNPAVMRYCLTGAVLGACIIYLDEFWQLVAEGIGVPILFFGVLSAAVLGVKIPAGLLAYRLKRRMYRVLALILCLHAAGYLLVFGLRNVFCVIPILILSASDSIAEPLVLGHLHHNTQTHVRATAESIYSLVMRILSIGVGLLFGYISTQHSVFAGFALLSGISFLYLLFYLFPGKSPADDAKGAGEEN